jgi:hypothetical protein
VLTRKLFSEAKNFLRIAFFLAAAKTILKQIKTNPLHKIFVAVTDDTTIGSLAGQLCLLNQNSYSGEARWGILKMYQ